MFKDGNIPVSEDVDLAFEMEKLKILI